MSICTIRLPIVRIFRDFDKMSTQEQQYSAMDGDPALVDDDNVDVTPGDQRCIIKFVNTNFGGQSPSVDGGSVSSNDEDSMSGSSSCCNHNTKPLSLRQRKRSSQNSPHKMSKAFSDSHSQCDECNASTFHHNCSSKRLNASASVGSPLRKHVLVRRSPSPSVREQNDAVAMQSNDTTTCNTNSYKLPLMRHFSVGLSPGYAQYQMDLLEVPMPRDYGDASSDDLSSEWDSDVQEPQPSPKVCYPLTSILDFQIYTVTKGKL